ncbi:MAG: hypothetical protein WC863_01255 [Patescibacteria group bacterium]
MAKPQLLDYIKKCSDQNFNKDQISAELTKVGWSAADINEAFAEFLSVRPDRSAVQSTAQSIVRPTTQPIVQPTVQPIAQPMTQSPVTENLVKAETKVTPPGKIKKSWSWPTIKFNRTSIIIISVLGVLFLGAGALAYFYYFPSPQRVLNKMVARLGSVQSLTYSSEIKVEYKISESLINSQAYLDIIDKNSTSSLFGASFSGPDASKNIHELTLNLIGQTDFQTNLKNSLIFEARSSEIAGGAKFALETRLINNWVYLNLDLPNLGFIDPSILKNQWLKLETATDLSKLADVNEPVVSTTTDNKNSLAQWFARSEQLKDALIESAAFKLNSVLASEQINNSATYHYSFAVDKTGLETFIIKANKILLAKDLNDQDIAPIKKNIDRIDLATGEIWIGQTDFLPYKISFNFTLKDKADDPIKVEKITLVLSGQNFNSPLTVKEPEYSRTVAQMMQEFLEPLLASSIKETASSSDASLATSTNLGELSTSSPVMSDQNIDSDSDGLTDYQEVNVYQTDPLNRDSDGDSYSDGEEVKNGYDPKGPGKLASSTVILLAPSVPIDR